MTAPQPGLGQLAISPVDFAVGKAQQAYWLSLCNSMLEAMDARDNEMQQGLRPLIEKAKVEMLAHAEKINEAITRSIVLPH